MHYLLTPARRHEDRFSSTTTARCLEALVEEIHLATVEQKLLVIHQALQPNSCAGKVPGEIGSLWKGPCQIVRGRTNLEASNKGSLLTNITNHHQTQGGVTPIGECSTNGWFWWFNVKLPRSKIRSRLVQSQGNEVLGTSCCVGQKLRENQRKDSIK